MLKYRIMNPEVPCKGCGMKPCKGKTSHDCFFPNLQIVNSYLQQHTEFEGIFSKSGKICYNCYCFCHEIVSHLHERSEDCTVKLVIAELKKMKCDTNIEVAATKAALMTAEMLLKQRATLLPRLHSLFVEWLKQLPLDPSDSCEELLNPSARWLMARLAKQLSPHISFSCKVKKLIYRKDGDLLQALSFALASQSSTSAIQDNCGMQTEQQTASDHTIKRLVVLTTSWWLPWLHSLCRLKQPEK